MHLNAGETTQSEAVDRAEPCFLADTESVVCASTVVEYQSLRSRAKKERGEKEAEEDAL